MEKEKKKDEEKPKKLSTWLVGPLVVQSLFTTFFLPEKGLTVFKILDMPVLYQSKSHTVAFCVWTQLDDIWYSSVVSDYISYLMAY